MKKMANKAWLADKSAVELCSQCSEARKAAATKVKLSIQDAILNRCRDYFSNFLSPVDATPTQIHEE